MSRRVCGPGPVLSSSHDKSNYEFNDGPEVGRSNRRLIARAEVATGEDRAARPTAGKCRGGGVATARAPATATAWCEDEGQVEVCGSREMRDRVFASAQR